MALAVAALVAVSIADNAGAAATDTGLAVPAAQQAPADTRLVTARRAAPTPAPAPVVTITVAPLDLKSLRAADFGDWSGRRPMRP